jgi:hypothetical protein
MTALEQYHDQPLSTPTSRGVRWRLVGLVGVAVVIAAGVIAWALDARVVDRWLATYTGIDDLSGSWYGFWSGFGSDLAELGLIGAVATGVYQMVRKYNCHEPRCWRVGTHPAADGQFLLCYRHHPDFHGRRPTHEVIERLHREHLAHAAAFHDRVEEIHSHVATGRAQPDETAGVAPAGGGIGSPGPTTS